jgi:quercetin dioxygenase-like cupin family protein
LAHRIALFAALVGSWCHAASSVAAPAGRTAVPQVRVVALPEGAQPFFPILAGPPETASMESGLVTLDPGKSVGVHSTKGYEELLVPLAGEGELRVPGRQAIPIKKGCAVYSPPGTEHDVVNTGKAALTYIFVVAKAP